VRERETVRGGERRKEEEEESKLGSLGEREVEGRAE
jgi:hypothetical protein